MYRYMKNFRRDMKNMSKIKIYIKIKKEIRKLDKELYVTEGKSQYSGRHGHKPI